MSIDIGQNIKKARKDSKITQKELALAINKSERMIQKYENNEVTPSFEIIKQISDFLRVDLHTLILDDAIETINDEINSLDQSFWYNTAKRRKDFRDKNTSTDEFEDYDLDEYIYSSIFDILTLSTNSKTLNYKLTDFSVEELDELSNFVSNSFRLKVNEILERHNK